MVPHPCSAIAAKREDWYRMIQQNAGSKGLGCCQMGDVLHWNKERVNTNKMASHSQNPSIAISRLNCVERLYFLG